MVSGVPTSTLPSAEAEDITKSLGSGTDYTRPQESQASSSLGSQLGPQTLVPSWPMVVLQGRPNPKSEPFLISGLCHATLLPGGMVRGLGAESASLGPYRAMAACCPQPPLSLLMATMTLVPPFSFVNELFYVSVFPTSPSHIYSS